MEWFAPIFGFVGVVVGVWLRGLLEDRRRWHTDRRTLYAEFLRASTEAERIATYAYRMNRVAGSNIDRFRGQAEELDAVGRTWESVSAEIRLMGSPDVVEASDALAHATRQLHVLLMPLADEQADKQQAKRLDDGWKRARETFEQAARSELGI